MDIPKDLQIRMLDLDDTCFCRNCHGNTYQNCSYCRERFYNRRLIKIYDACSQPRADGYVIEDILLDDEIVKVRQLKANEEYRTRIQNQPGFIQGMLNRFERFLRR
jgi:hypothetical protein